MATTLITIAIAGILFAALFAGSILFYYRVVDEWRCRHIINKAIRTFGFEDNRTIAIAVFADSAPYKEVKRLYKTLVD